MVQAIQINWSQNIFEIWGQRVPTCSYPHSTCQPVNILFSDILHSKIWFSTKFLIKQGLTYVSLSYFFFTFFSPQPYDAMIDFLNLLKMLNMPRMTPKEMDSTFSSKKKYIIRSHWLKSVQIQSYFCSIFSSIRIEYRALFVKLRI